MRRRSALPVYTPATAEAFATYGVVDTGATIQPLLAPEGVIPQFGGLEVTTSSTAVQALTDAVLYLAEFEYTSADAYASRILAIAALRDVLEAFEAEGIPTPGRVRPHRGRRHRRARGAPELGRRLVDLAPQLPDLAVSLGARDARALRGGGQRLHGAGQRPGPGPRVPPAHRGLHSPGRGAPSPATR